MKDALCKADQKNDHLPFFWLSFKICRLQNDVAQKCIIILFLKGHGDLDVLLIKDLLPHLTQYYAVECDQDQCRALKDNIARIEGRNIEVRYDLKVFSDYNTHGIFFVIYHPMCNIVDHIICL